MKVNERKNKTTYHRSPNDKDHPYTVISNNLIKTDKLNFIAKSIMIYILSNRDDFIINKNHIFSRSGVPKKKFDDAWNTLKQLGCITPKRIQGGVEWIFTESPESIKSTGIRNECSNNGGVTNAGDHLISTNNKEVPIKRNKKMNIKEYSTLNLSVRDFNHNSLNTTQNVNGNTFDNSKNNIPNLNPSTDRKPLPKKKVVYGDLLSEEGKQCIYNHFYELTKEEVESTIFQLTVDQIESNPQRYILKSRLNDYPNYNSR